MACSALLDRARIGAVRRQAYRLVIADARDAQVLVDGVPDSS
jgi:ribosomal protein S16